MSVAVVGGGRARPVGNAGQPAGWLVTEQVDELMRGAQERADSGSAWGRVKEKARGRTESRRGQVPGADRVAGKVRERLQLRARGGGGLAMRTEVP